MEASSKAVWSNLDEWSENYIGVKVGLKDEIAANTSAMSQFFS